MNEANVGSGALAPEQITRILFEGFTPAAVTLFYALAWAAIAAFAWGCYVQVRKLRRGQPDPVPLADLGRRLLQMAASVLSHRTVARRDAAAGRAHRLIFYGFALLFVGTSIITLQVDVSEPLLGWRFWYGDFYLVFSLVLDLAGVALIAGLIYMMVRRGWIRPPRLDYARPDRRPGDPDYDRSFYRREDWAFLWTLVTIGVTGFLLEAARLVWLQDRPGVWSTRIWSPVGAVIAEAMRGGGLSSAAAGALREALWWFHGILALAFIAVVPWSKVKHIFTAMGSLAVRDPLAAQRLPKLQPDAPQAGYARITDLTWKHLLQLDACTKCGRCHEACPARAAGAPLSPRDLILSLREHSNHSLERNLVTGDADLDIHGGKTGQVSQETLWSCRTCMACVEICPVAIEHVPIIVQMRRKLVESGQMDPLLQKTLQTIHKSGNSFGESKRKRGAWTKTLPFPIKDARKEPVDLLWFVGDYASFDPRNQKVSQVFARLLHAAGVDFGILYDAESNAGNDVRRVGEEGLYEHLAESNIAALGAARFQRIVTTDPHSLNTIRNEYPQFGGSWQIIHYTTLLLELQRQGRLRIEPRLALRTTYHDPCHLGRFNKEYDAPRELLRATGCELIEMARSRDNSFCCGAGGGRIWMPDPVGKEKPSQIRIREAAGIEGLEVFVVACPKDLTMFEDAVKTTGNEGRIVVRELLELVEQCATSEAGQAEPAVA
ncbi:MAG: (Fe-S)-binding protein [Betaproteobacteria bacterium]|nr:MAG: (Fe-S)-binding protein [Betaproteobacteria bacterium]